MSTQHRGSRLGSLTIALFMLSVATPSTAQEPDIFPDSSTHTPFAIASTSEFAYSDADAVIIRRVGSAVPDVVLLRESEVSPTLVASAVRQLAALRAAMGNRPADEHVFRVRNDLRHWRRPREVANWIAWLRGDEPQFLDRIGAVRHIILQMPNQGRQR